MTAVEDFEHLLMLTGFNLSAHALRLLGKAGMLDSETRTLIREYLEGLQEKIDAMPEDQREFFDRYLDVLTTILPPAARGGGSPTAE